MPTVRRMRRIKEVLERRDKGIILVLEDIHDPHNAAAILRTADAFGIQEVYVIYEKERYMNLRRVGRQSSSSANRWLSIKFFQSTRSCYQALRRKRYVIYGTAVHSSSQDLFTEKFIHKKTAFVFGNEHRGLSQYAMNHADHILFIPMKGFVESLNVSVSAGICLFELVRQRWRGKRGMHYNKKEMSGHMRRFFPGVKNVKNIG